MTEDIIIEAKKNRIREALSSPLFLVLSIIMTGMNFATTATNVFNILFTIGMWMAYVSAKSGESEMNIKGLKLLCGTAKAMKIVFLVLAILVVVIGIIGVVVFAASGNTIASEFDAYFENGGYSTLLSFYGFEPSSLEPDLAELALGLSELQLMLGVSMGYVICLILSVLCFVAIACGGIFIVFYFTLFSSLCDFVNSIRDGANDEGAPVLKARSVKIWAIVLGILSALSVLTTYGLDAYLLLSPAFMIMGFVWIGKYFE